MSRTPIQELNSTATQVDKHSDAIDAVFSAFDTDHLLRRTLNKLGYEGEAKAILATAAKLYDEITDLHMAMTIEAEELEEKRQQALAQLTDEQKELLGVK